MSIGFVAVLACGGHVDGVADADSGDAGSSTDSSSPLSDGQTEGASDAGATKHTCNAQGVTVLAKGEWPEQMAIDDSYVYWGDNIRTGYRRVPKDGGKVETVTTQGFPPGQGLAVDDTSIFADTFLMSTTGHVTTAPKTGGAYTMIAMTPGAMGLVVDSTNVYWAEWLGSLWFAAKPNGAPKVLVKDAWAYFIARDGGYLYYTSNAQNAAGVKRVLVGGGSPEVLASVAFNSLIVVDSSDVYWFNLPSTQNYGSVLSRVSKSGGMATDLAKDSTQTFTGLAVDDTYVYWSDAQSIHRLPKAGGSPTTIATAQPSVKTLAVDDRCLYFMGTNEIRAMPK